jgi:hypothetical protein
VFPGLKPCFENLVSNRKHYDCTQRHFASSHLFFSAHFPACLSFTATAKALLAQKPPSASDTKKSDPGTTKAAAAPATAATAAAPATPANPAASTAAAAPATPAAAAAKK